MSSEIDIALRVLDRQLLDADGRRCGKVDDLAIQGGPDEIPQVVALLVGPGYWPQRAGRIGSIASWIGRNRKARVPWKHVASLDSAVRLETSAPELGLGLGDDRLGRYLEKIPGADR